MAGVDGGAARVIVAKEDVILLNGDARSCELGFDLSGDVSVGNHVL